MDRNRGPMHKRQRRSVLSKQARSQRMRRALEKIVRKRIAMRSESVTPRKKELAERKQMDAGESANTVIEVPGSWQVVSDVPKDSNINQNLFGDLQQPNLVQEISGVAQGPSVDQNVSELQQNSNVAIEVSSSVPYSKETTVKQKKPLKEAVTIHGRRIIDVAFFLEALKDLNKHSKSKCDLNDMLIIREGREGLVSCFYMKCMKCKFQSLVWSEDPENESQDINSEAVAGVVSISGDYWDLGKLLTKMCIPMMTKYMFDKEYKKISHKFENNLEKESETAHFTDKEITIQPMEIDEFLVKDPDEIDRDNVEEYDEPVETPLPPREIEVVVNEDKPVESDITKFNGITIKQEIEIDTDDEKLTHESGAEASLITEREIEKALEKEIDVFQCNVKPEKVEDVQVLNAESDVIAVVQEPSTCEEQTGICQLEVLFGGVTAVEESSTASQDAERQFKSGQTTTMRRPSTAIQANVQRQFNLAGISAAQEQSKTIHEGRLQHNITPAQKLPTTTYVKSFQSGFCVLSSDVDVVQKLLTTKSVKGLQCSLKPPSPSLKPGVPASVSQQQGESHRPRVSSSETDSSNTSVVQARMAASHSRRCPEYHNLIEKPKTKSPVWQYFGLPANESGKILDVNIAVCKICLNPVVSRGGGTSNLKSHLKVHHPLKFTQLSSSSGPTSINQASISTISIVDVDDPPAATSDNANNPKNIPLGSPKRQKTVHDFEPLDARSERQCTQAVTEFLAVGMLSYRIVEHPKFVNMLKILNPRYNLPSRKYFSTTGIPNLYLDTVEKIKREMVAVEEADIVITTDCWTSVAKTPFMAITVHFVTADWELKNICLNCRCFMEDHTAENISEMLSDTLSEWNIDVNKLSCGITDNGTNIVKAMSLLKINNLSCFAHNINIGVNRALQLPELKRAVARLKCLQNSIAHGWKMRRDLDRAQELLQMDRVNLPSVDPTRWWSTLKLCQMYLHNQLPICKMLMDHPTKKYLMLEGSDTTAIENFVSATTMLRELTETLSGSDYVTASCVLPLFREIKKNLNPKEADSPLLCKIKSEILGALTEKYEGKSTMVEMLGFSSLCDPRIRIHFLEAPEMVKKAAISKMADIYENLSEKSNPGNKQASPKKKKGLAKFLTYEKEKEMECSLETGSLSMQKADKEMNNYLSMPIMDMNENPLNWWKAHHTAFPLLSVLARKYLGIPGTSVPSESVFSTAGHVISMQRASLLPKNAEMQVFLAKNYKFV